MKVIEVLYLLRVECVPERGGGGATMTDIAEIY